MNREAIEARLAQLRADLAKVNGTYAAINGAIADCEYWLTQLDAEAVSPPPVDLPEPELPLVQEPD